MNGDKRWISGGRILTKMAEGSVKEGRLHGGAWRAKRDGLPPRGFLLVDILFRACVREVEAKVKSLSWRSHCRKRRTGLPLSRVCKTASSNTPCTGLETPYENESPVKYR
ncbi:hypothetical protein K0M31_002567 [Melipona bicolor]|uniref:Uncharacterized protein n=1 Tax=Melipona bicolor TaxID=60889 RepID=A0AA40KYR6_9HYME|nr:hypothetical protein K0M31_002567 [Melipona bicolor]